MFPGKVIAIEGIDGSGKGTQCRLLVDALTSQGVPFELFTFPQYEATFFGKEVGRFLRGEFGQLDEVHPKFSALLYALDRFEVREKIVAALKQGKTVICDRYTPSNVAHQSARVAAAEREAMMNWIQCVEHEVLGLPRPDLVIFLASTVRTSHALVERKEKRSYTDDTHDIQEASKDHLQLALDQFMALANGAAWKTVNCLDATGNLRSPLAIHGEILAHVRAVLA